MSNQNAAIQDRYDELMRLGKHGHYETLFQIVREFQGPTPLSAAGLVQARAMEDISAGEAVELRVTKEGYNRAYRAAPY